MTDLETLVDEVERGEALSDASRVRSPWSTTLPTLQLAWDSTSLGVLKSCAYKYYLSIIRGFQTPYQRAELDFGILLHKAFELYDKWRAEPMEHHSALLKTLRWAILATWDSERQRPWTSDEPTRTRDTLLRTIVWYLDRFQDDPIETLILASGKPAVELSFKIPLGRDERFVATTGEEFSLCGHIDKVGIWNRSGSTRPWIKDVKTTRYELDDTYFRQFSPDNQMSLYDVAGQVILETETAGVIIDACQILVTGGRFRRKEIPRSAELREEWMESLAMWLQFAQHYAQNERWPMNEMSCGYGRRQCQFRPACSLDPSAREEFLNVHYVKRMWNPLETR